MRVNENRSWLPSPYLSLYLTQSHHLWLSYLCTVAFFLCHHPLSLYFASVCKIAYWLSFLLLASMLRIYCHFDLLSNNCWKLNIPSKQNNILISHSPLSCLILWSSLCTCTFTVHRNFWQLFLTDSNNKMLCQDFVRIARRNLSFCLHSFDLQRVRVTGK